jgi:peptidyl-prolyl cis-trans isomerase A (cyclophilin A)
MKKLLVVMCFAGMASAQTAGLPAGLYAIFTTSKGVITAKLYEKYTPESVRNFVGLAQGTKPWKEPKTGAMVKRPMYDNITFHRVIRNEMIQAGDPTGTSAHDCGITLRDEFLPGLTFNRPGRLAVANTGAPDSGACQFFITTGAVTEWDNKYTIFGDVVKGIEVVNAINHAPLRGDKPVDPVALKSVRIERVGPEPVSKAKPRN